MKFATRRAFIKELLFRAKDGRLPAINEKRQCRYRTADGKACVAGICLPDEKYIPNMEGRNFDPYFATDDYPPDVNQDLLVRMQSSHDFAVRDSANADFYQFFLNNLLAIPAIHDEVKGVNLQILLIEKLQSIKDEQFDSYDYFFKDGSPRCAIGWMTTIPEFNLTKEMIKTPGFDAFDPYAALLKVSWIDISSVFYSKSSREEMIKRIEKL